jgi:hypothetical protein
MASHFEIIENATHPCAHTSGSAGSSFFPSSIQLLAAFSLLFFVSSSLPVQLLLCRLHKSTTLCGIEHGLKQQRTGGSLSQETSLEGLLLRTLSRRLRSLSA